MFSSNTSQVSSDAVYVEDVFSNFLYTGNGSTQTINNGIDLAGEGGLVWTKSRSNTYWHEQTDTVRGASKYISSNSTIAQQNSQPNHVTAFNSNGFSVGNELDVNANGDTFVSWTFRKQPKFFDVVTFSTTSSSSVPITVNHNLGSVPGCIIVKQTNGGSDWFVYHRSLGSSQYLALNSTDLAQNGGTSKWAATPTATAFTLGGDFVQNATYVAYLFAHNAGGFGLSGTDNVISCGSYVGNGATVGPVVTLGYEPQWILVKDVTATDGFGNWFMFDNMRGWPVGSNGQQLRANSSSSEGSADRFVPTATGFNVTNGYSGSNVNGNTYIYIAIRRGPMKTPTTGTSVFSTLNRTGTGTTTSVTGIGLTPDLLFTKNRFNSGLGRWDWQDRLRGPDRNLFSDGTDAEYSNSSNPSLTAFGMDGVTFGNDQWNGYTNYNSSNTYINYFLRRAPGFFDEVCYTGNGTSGRTVTHNLSVVPELMIVKDRSDARDWAVYYGNRFTYAILNSDSAPFTTSTIWNDTAPTASVFTVGNNSRVNASNETFVAYLFASCPGVSKVFNFTGNGSSQTINCGFTGGARFVMIKRTDSTGDWYVWDSARGIVSGNDPRLSLNTTAAEVTTDDSVDTDSTGFVVNQLSATNVNVNGASYIGLAIA